MNAEAISWSGRYLQLAMAARANAARCTDPAMCNDFLEVASGWEQMANESGSDMGGLTSHNQAFCWRSPGLEGTRDWRQIPHAGVAVIVKEVNAAIGGQDIGPVSLVSKPRLLDFWFGERIFRLILRSHVPWRPWDQLAEYQVYRVLVRRATLQPLRSYKNDSHVFGDDH